MKFDDSRGPRVYVIGAGPLYGDTKARNAYRDPLTMAALKRFRMLYLPRSNANVQAFGAPGST